MSEYDDTAREYALRAEHAAETAELKADAANNAANNAASIAAARVSQNVESMKTAAQNAASASANSASAAADAAVRARAAGSAVAGYAQQAENSAEHAENERESAQEAASQASDNAGVVASYLSLANVAKEDAILAKTQTQAIYDSVRATVATYEVGVCYGYGVTVDGTMISFTWNDPLDNDIVKWARSRLIMKQGGFPVNESDGYVLLDETVRNQHSVVPFTWDAGSLSGYYFALFTQSTGGAWNTGSNAPRFTTDALTWGTIGMMSRTGTLLSYPNMQIGSVVPYKMHDNYPATRLMLASVDYKSTFPTVGDYMEDATCEHNSIWIPQYLPCPPNSQNAQMFAFDTPENAYGRNVDTTFIASREYYVYENDAYTKLTAGTDYTTGESCADWEEDNDKELFVKNHASRVSYGNNIWKESDMRQRLNGRGNDYFVPQNPFDTNYGGDFVGFLTGIDENLLARIQRVRNITARNTVSAASWGGGGGYDVTLDRVWLPSIKEVFNTNNNGIPEGQQFSYFSDVATTSAQRIQRDEGGAARVCWLRSPYAGNVNFEYNISTSGGSNYSNAYISDAFLFAICIA